MPKFVIEREIPGAGSMSAEQLKGAAQSSNQVIRELGPNIQWEHSYVTGDKIFCIYNAPDEAMIRTHAAKAGIPANKITPVATVIGPGTAQG
ncbi:DUF4242 domain-containing protein [Extensimonas sp. H3M7-6]|uniref:DUF4242 domain-containing protein n=1 Tax=Extensimonas soli TaxID=3031322 RepID=UPI0023DC9D32|nr:DUF4242 domain-containing protein [Extensimonas sp. H3M7-6]MDF1481791.1 DUF4242 domain-containing protein [Extensimonas sp. H3M7-6]